MAAQSYSNPAGRNTSCAGDMKGGAKPGTVSVPVPGTNTTQPAYKGGMKQSPAGFQGGLINGKV